VAVFPGDAVEATVVDAHSKRAIGFFDKEYWSTIWGSAGLDELLGQEVVQLFLKLVQLGNGEADNRLEGWVRHRVCLDAHGVAAVGGKTGRERGGEDIGELVVDNGVYVRREGRRWSWWNGGDGGLLMVRARLVIVVRANECEVDED
jgi:hypothetical protein